MKVDLNLLKELRDITKAPLWDCKKVLIEAEGDLQKAQELLRKRWILKAWKKADRETNFWVVKFKILNDNVVWVKVLCETDFVAKNELFLKIVDDILEKISNLNWAFDFNSVSSEVKEDIQRMLDENVATIWESMKLADLFKDSVWTWAYVYNHMWNTISSVVWYEWWDESLAKMVVLQVAAMNPSYISMDDIPEDVYNAKKEEFMNDESLKSKLEDIRLKIVEWKLHKYFQDDVLLEQQSIVDNTKTVKNMIGDMKIKKFLRINIG